jgi:hypothetical protein
MNRDTMTYACVQGWHGSAERRTMADVGGMSGMYTGRCAGTLRWSDGAESECSCECHNESKMMVVQS